MLNLAYSFFVFKAAEVFQLLPEQIKAGESIAFDEIKGYMTITEAAKATKTELKEFYKKFEIPENVPADTKMKEISKIVSGYDFDKVKGALESSSDEVK